MTDEEKKDILFQIDMQLYGEFNDKFCEMNDNLGTVYFYKDLDDLEKLEKETEIKLLREAIKKQQKEIEELKEDNKKYKELIIKLRNLSSGVVSYEIINGKKYYGPRKNFSKQRLYEQFLQIKLLLKSNYIFLSNEDYLKELEKE